MLLARLLPVLANCFFLQDGCRSGSDCSDLKWAIPVLSLASILCVVGLLLTSADITSTSTLSVVLFFYQVAFLPPLIFIPILISLVPGGAPREEHPLQIHCPHRDHCSQFGLHLVRVSFVQLPVGCVYCSRNGMIQGNSTQTIPSYAYQTTLGKLVLTLLFQAAVVCVAFPVVAMCHLALWFIFPSISRPHRRVYFAALVRFLIVGTSPCSLQFVLTVLSFLPSQHTRPSS